MPRTYLFEGGQIRRLSGLLDMEYKPSELAEEMGVTSLVVYRRWIPAGCPHRRDDNNLIWIHGTSFAEWAAEINRSEHEAGKRHLELGQGWCLKCRSGKQIVDAQIIPVRRGLDRMVGKCEGCGGVLSRWIKHGKGEDDTS